MLCLCFSSVMVKQRLFNHVYIICCGRNLKIIKDDLLITFYVLWDVSYSVSYTLYFNHDNIHATHLFFRVYFFVIIIVIVFTKDVTNKCFNNIHSHMLWYLFYASILYLCYISYYILILHAKTALIYYSSVGGCKN